MFGSFKFEYFRSGAVAAIAVFLASVLSNHYGHSYIFWFIGGAVMGFGGFIFNTTSRKRTPLRAMIIVLGTGLAAATGVALVNLFGLD